MFRKGFQYLDEPYRGLVCTLLSSLRGVLGTKLVSVAVFGSVARREYRRESDLDILVIAENLPRHRSGRIKLFEDAEEKVIGILDNLLDRGYAISLSPVILTPQEAEKVPPIFLDMVEDAVIVYDRGRLLEKILERVRRRLEELGAERIYVGKKWYWRLKKDFRFGEVITIE